MIPSPAWNVQTRECFAYKIFWLGISLKIHGDWVRDFRLEMLREPGGALME